MSHDKSMIYQREQVRLGEKVTDAGITVREWMSVSQQGRVVTMVINGEAIAGAVLNKREVEALTINLIAWLGDNDNEHTTIKEGSNSVHAGANSRPGPGRPA